MDGSGPRSHVRRVSHSPALLARPLMETATRTLLAALRAQEELERGPQHRPLAFCASGNQTPSPARRKQVGALRSFCLNYAGLDERPSESLPPPLLPGHRAAPATSVPLTSDVPRPLLSSGGNIFYLKIPFILNSPISLSHTHMHAHTHAQTCTHPLSPTVFVFPNVLPCL